MALPRASVNCGRLFFLDVLFGSWNLNEFIQKPMKARTLLAVAAAAVTLTSSALGDKYSDLVTKGYR